jgi:lycopene cyclase domain-containing protein
MKGLYLALDLFTLACPLLLSFEKRVHFFKQWKFALGATLLIAIPFVIWDALFTSWGFWGFNTNYTLGIHFAGLPLEELTFFIVVPFACTFIYEVCLYYFSPGSLRWFNRIFLFAIPAYALLLALIGGIGYYTLSVVISSALVLLWSLLTPKVTHIGIAFLFSLAPFFVVNGILTGSFIDEPVVWYSEAQKVSPRLFTIPMEDILYSFTLIGANILVYEQLKAKWGKRA